MKRIHLSPPHIMGRERELVLEAIDSNWVAPLGPMVDAFESEFATEIGLRHAVAMSSGTAALHLAMVHHGIGRGDEVVTATLTFAATAFAIRHTGATPIFIDSESESWNIDPDLLSRWLDRRGRIGRLPRAVIPVHLYGQSAAMASITAACERWGVPVIEDAAEALGSSLGGRAPGSFGACGIWSFNGNKIITSSGGGMLATDDVRLANHVRKLATQAREPTVHYQHEEIGYNCRLSNISAAIGRAQLETLAARVERRRANFEFYRERLDVLPGISLQPEVAGTRHSRWLTCCLVDPAEFGVDREALRTALDAAGIEARPIWKPMHLQPVFAGTEVVGGVVAERLYEQGLCLPSGSQMSKADLERVVDVMISARRSGISG